MKKVIIAVMILLTSCAPVVCQKVKIDSAGNYVAVRKELSKGEPTGKYFVDAKGQKFQVFKSVRGKLYYERTSKAGNVYKVYLKL